MARIPEVRPQTSTPLVPSGGRINVAAAGAPGQALAAAGEDLSRGASSLAVAKSEFDARSAAMDASKRIAEARLYWNDQALQREQDAPEDPTGYADTLIGEVRKDLADRTAGAPALAQNYMTQRFAGLLTDLGTRAQAFERNRQAQRTARNLQSTLDQSANALTVDPAQFEATIGDVTGAISASALPAPTKIDAIRDARDRLAQSAIEGGLRLSPGETRKQLEAGNFDAFLKPGSKDALLSRARAEDQRAQHDRIVLFADQVDQATAELRSHPDELDGKLAVLDHAITGLGLEKAPAAELRRKAEDGFARATIRGESDKDPTTTLARLKKGEWDKLLAGGSKSVMQNELEAEIHRRETEARTRTNARRTALHQAVHGLVKRLSDVDVQNDPGNEAVAQLRSEARALDDPQTLDQLANAEGLAAFARDASVMAPAQLQTLINAERAKLGRRRPAEGVTGFEAQRLDLAEKILERQRKEATRDPLSYAQSVGLADVPPLTVFNPPAQVEAGTGQVADPNAAARSMGQRAGVAQAVAAHLGVRPRFLTDEEARTMEAAFDTPDVDRQLALITSLNHGFGDFSPEVFKELKIKDPIVAHVGGLAAAGSRPETLRDALIGRRARAEGNVLAPQPSDAASWTQDTLGEALAYLPDTRAAVLDTAKAIFHTRMVRAGQTDPFDGKEIWKGALQEAVGGLRGPNGDVIAGGVGNWNGAALILPPATTEAEFQGALEHADQLALEIAGVGNQAPHHADGTPFKPSELAQSWLVSIGDGQYIVSVTDPYNDAPQWIQGGGEHGYYVLDFNRLQAGLGR